MYYLTFPIFSCSSQDLLKYGIFLCVTPDEIKKKNPEFSFSVLNMHFLMSQVSLRCHYEIT